jgi:hypothetical protein
MRPVNRGPVPPGPPPAPYYPNNIPLDTLVNLANAAHQGPPWNFQAASVITALGTNNPSRWLLLALEYCLATLTVPTWNLPPGLTLPNANAASATVERRLAAFTPGAATGGYQAAGAPLGARLGKFCSYCEQFLPGQIAVEHCTPKSPFPLFTLCWDNFLLACDACNGPTGKGQNPSRATVDGWGPFADDCARNVAIRGTAANPGQAEYVWPDLNPLAYRNLLPVLTVWHAPNWVPLPYVDSVMPGSTITALDLPTRAITATVHFQGNWYQNQRVAVWLQAADAQATRSIPYFGLDNAGTGTGKIADCRMYNRTIAWFKAIQFLTPLALNLGAAWPIVWPLLLAAAPSVGFLSVWVRVMDRMGLTAWQAPGSNPPVSVTQQFLNTMANAADGFPNTNTAAMP